MKKIVLLGDSIRLIGYGKRVCELLSDNYEVWQPDDNCRFSSYTLRLIYDNIGYIKDADIIHWNNGLWDTCHLFDDGTFTSIAVYVENMKRIARILLTLGKKVVFATTTPVTPSNPITCNDDIDAFNKAVVPALQKMGVLINDLNKTVLQNIDEYIRKDDNIHLSEKGIEVCAKQVTDFIKDSLS